MTSQTGCADAPVSLRRARVSGGSSSFSQAAVSSLVLYSRNRMSDRTETLTVGSRAPEFLLSAANRDGILSLSGFLSRGALIVEFLRGTW